jgi:LPXTG-motif cell wall-anchored protein
MSRATLPVKVGVAMAVAAFAIGLTAANAIAWPNEQPAPTQQHGDKDNNKHKGDKGEEENEGKGEKPPQPEQPTPPTGQQTPPAPPATPAAPPPVTSQGGPPPVPEQPPVTTENVPKQPTVPENPVITQAPPQPGAPAVPVAERRELAKTGLDPALIALLGAMCLGGGALLFRRALARN